jgi:general secretion pathway protein D
MEKLRDLNMKRNHTHLHAFAALLMALCLLGAPLTAFAKKKGEKNFKKGLEHEAAQQWEQAAQEFTLALAANPADTEFRLHYQRAVFNASQFLMQRGRSLMDNKDYLGAYNAFRQAFAYDPVNELAQQEMARAMRMYSEREQAAEDDGKGGAQARPGGVQVRPTAYSPNAEKAKPRDNVRPKSEEVGVFEYNNQDLKSVISILADRLELNVIFDPETFRQQRNITIKLRNITMGQALDYIFLQEGLFFQRLTGRTILVANQTRRAQFQALVLRTFFLSNAKPEDARNLIQQAIPPNQGRPSTIVLVDKDTNSLTVRDTAENIRLIENLIASIDKDRAEVVMDVQIYEVSKSDLLQLGNQVGSSNPEAPLTLGGATGVSRANFGTSQVSQLAGIAGGLPTALAAAVLLPRMTLTAFQSRNNGRLLASTQIHAFNNEESQARIGQRVPVQTASTFPAFGNFNGNGNGNNQGNNSVFNQGIPVIQYEPVGLTLKFTPIVYPNLDVQVKMNIESKDVTQGLQPTFTERTITGTARIQNNRTMLLASVAQTRDGEGRAGLPILAGLPIFGRLFSTPRKDSSQVDIVIAVTPRVLRAPSITPEDLEMRDSGTLQMPTSGSIAQLVEQANRDDQLAAETRAKQQPPAANPVVNAGETASFVPAERPATPAPVAGQPEVIIEVDDSRTRAAAAKPAMQPVSVPSNTQPAAPQMNVRDAVQTLVNANAINTSAPATKPETKDKPQNNHAPANTPANTPTVEISGANDLVPTIKPDTPGILANAGAQLTLMTADTAELRAGGKQRIAVMLESDAPLNSALVALKFNPALLRVTALMPGDAGPGARLMQHIDPNGKVSVMLMPEANAVIKAGATALFYLEVEALGAGANALDFDRNGMRLTTTENRDAFPRYAETGLTIK